MQKNVEVLPDGKALTDRALAPILEKIPAAIQQRGRFTIALSGGNTPKPLYEAMATQDLPWEQIHVFWGDERYVPPEHPDSNQKMAREAWLDRVSIPAANIHPMPTAPTDPATAAKIHETELREFFNVSGEEFPVLDVILLGMGDDGHTASLFPHTDALQVGASKTSAGEVPLVVVGNKDGQPRLTFTAPLINHARCVLFIVAGANKQPALAQIFAASGDPLTYPARLIQPEGELWWLLDRSAGENLISH